VTTPGEKNPRPRKTIRRVGKNPESPEKKVSFARKIFLKHGIIIAPW
jgi:hypothetical protein